MSINRSLRSQLLTLQGASVFLVILIALFCFRYLSQAVTAYSDLMSGTLKSSQMVDTANLEFKIQVQEWKNVLLRGKKPESLDKYWKQFESQESKVNAQLTALQTLATNQNDPALVSQIKELLDEHTQLGVAYRKGKDVFLAAGADPTVGDKAVTGIDRGASEKMSALVKLLHEKAEKESLLIREHANRAVLIGIVTIIASSVLVILFGIWLINRRIIHPVRDVIGYITQLSQGHFERGFQIQRQDELGSLAKAANILRDSLFSTFTQLKQSIDQLDQSSSKLKNTASIMAGSARDQLGRTDLVATAMHEMSATAQDVANSAETAAVAANQADRAAQEGELVMQSTITMITRMSGEIENTAGVIQQLDEDSRRISTVLEVIRNIADQTNLLALNAAIEAARAGEHGRGFAVVADEVRTLAKRTADSTAEINTIITTVQSGTKDAVQAIASSRLLSGDSVEKVTEAGDMLQQITTAISEIHDMTQQIATAAEEQTSVVEDISRNLIEIKDIATDNQDNANVTEGTSHQLHTISSELHQTMHKLMN
ncbi:methyl-accepting chemotaxis protein [uncultured Tolumonas sp.]|uniref:methyl-accepting chemotaxis protein n=1 Tax=uncultured Tolumonas sp. TaxID=263765 RepID=UPI002A0A5600|nr:methyl-accepting chemotaxis protein [uncultured Tolumonas sp.]